MSVSHDLPSTVPPASSPQTPKQPLRLLLLALSLLPYSAFAQVTLHAGAPQPLALPPRQEQPVRVIADSAQYNEVRVLLPTGGVFGSYVKVLLPTVSGTEQDPVISDSGEPFVRIALPPGTVFPLTLRLVGLTNSKSDTAPLAAQIVLTASAPSPTHAAETKTLTAFNHGERLRRAHTNADEALAAYREAAAGARSLHDPVLEQRALLSAGRMMMTGGKHYPEAVDLERQAVAIDTTAAAPSVEAMAWKTLGGALLNTGAYEESATASRRALALYEQTGETYWQGIVLENLGSALLSLGELDTALVTDERALAISRTLHDDFGVVEMLAEIGSIHESRGEYQEALDDFSDAVEVALPTSYNPMQGEAWLAMGRLHQSLGEPDLAGPDFQKALTIAQHTASGLDELDALGDLAKLALTAGKPELAQTAFTQALARARELKVVRPQSALLIGLAECASALGLPDEAELLLHQAIDLSASIHQTAATAEAYTKLGEIEERLTRLADAEKHFAQAATLYESIPDKAGTAQADASLARVERAHGEPAQALGHLLKALDIIESSRASLAQGGLRTRYFTTQRAAYGQTIALLMELDRAQPNSGYAAQAWMIAERAQARSLLDELSSSGAAQPKDPASAALERRLAALDVQIRAAQVSLAQTGTTPADLEAANRIGGELRQALLAADELQSRIRHDTPIATGDPLPPAAFAAKALTPQDALIEYWAGPEISYAWLIAADGSCTAFQLPPLTDLERRIADHRKALLARDESAPLETLAQRKTRLAHADRTASDLGEELATTLFPEAMQARLHDIHRLIIVPDGPLTSLPFAALRLRATYLVERFDLVQEPSAAFLAQADALKKALPSRIAIFADPVYNLADARLAANQPVTVQRVASIRRDADTADLTHLSRLPGSRREALAIQQIVGPSHVALFLGFDATPAAVHDLDWSQFSIAHFAAHAIARPGGRDLSGILLSMLDPHGQRRNGVLWLRDIVEPRVPRQLVVLSGCGTALGEAIPGEGMNSLTRAFLFSGTRQVAATLWSADDAGAGLLMGSFYRALIGKGLTAPAALREAQRSVLADPRYAAPYFWAGFMVEGRWKTP